MQHTGMEPTNTSAAPAFDSVQRWTTSVPSEASLDHIVNYFKTWSAFQAHQSTNAEEANTALHTLHTQLGALLPQRVRYSVPIFMILARRCL